MKIFIGLMLMVSLAFCSNAIAANKKRSKAYRLIKSLKDRIDVLEENSDLNIFKLSGGVIVNYDSFDFSGHLNNVTITDVDRSVNWFRMLGYLNFDANPYDDLKFYSRYSFSKFFNTAYNLADDPYDRLSYSRSHTGPQVYVEKFYFDWSASENVTFSAGRLPGFDGAPLHYATGDARMGTYPMLAFNNILDGLALSYSMKSWVPDNHNFSFRLVYTPMTFPTSKLSPVGNTVEESSAEVWSNEGGTKNYMNQTTALILDYSAEDLSWARNLSGILLLQSVGSISLKMQIEGLLSDNVIGLDYMSAHFDVEDIFNSGLSMSFTYLASSIASEGFVYLDDPDRNPLANGDGVMDPAESIGGFHTEAASAKNIGGGYLLSVRYQLPINFLKRPFLGVEYIVGDEYHYFMNSAYMDLDNFYAVQGDGIHAYYTQPIKDSFSVTFGYRQRNQIWGGEQPGFPAVVNNHPYGKRAQLVKPEVSTTIYVKSKLTF